MRALEIIVTITQDGKLLVNSPIDLPVGEYNAVLVLEDQPISSNIQTSVQEAQALLRKYIPASRRLSQELIEERRLESLSE
jgi:acetaldehyde dehydrogenase (acetylating)